MKKIRFTIISKKVRGGMIGIFIQCSQSIRSVSIDTGVRIFQDEWYQDDCMIINNPNAVQLNKTIRKCVYELQDMEFSKSDDGMSLDRLVKIWKAKDSYFDFYAFIEQRVKEDDIRCSTARLHLNTLSLMKKYKPRCLSSEIDEEYVEGFYLFLRKHTFLEGRHYEVATINRHMQMLRSYYNKAKKQFPKKIADIDFSQYKIRTASEKSIRALEEIDIKTLEKLVNCEYRHKDALVVDQFLFMSYTGCRYSDFISLRAGSQRHSAHR